MDPLDVTVDVIGFPHPFQEGDQRLALDQTGGSDLYRGGLKQLASAARLEFEDLFEVPAAVMGSDGVRDRLPDLVEPGKPGWWSGQGVPPLESPANRLVCELGKETGLVRDRALMAFRAAPDYPRQG